MMKKKFSMLLSSMILLSCVSFAGNQDKKNVSDPDPSSPLEGRWDLTIHDGQKDHPSWLEVYRSGSKWLVGQYVGIGGSARPVSVINFKDGKFNFSIPPQWEQQDRFLSFEGTINNDKLTGTLVAANGQTYHWTGVRAPRLDRDKAPTWGKPISLFNGKDLSGWKPMGNNQWIAENGVLTSPHSGANLVTEQKFNDFKLHIEFKCPKGSNSGIYLRGRYEIQIIDSHEHEPVRNTLGAIYGFLTPTSMPDKGPDEWQTFDITLIGRNVTIVFNGVETICNRPIPGITGGALDSNEGEPGPIYLQGDHGPIQYRNITLTPAVY